LAQREVAQAHVFEQLQRVGNAGHAMTTRRRTRASMCWTPGPAPSPACACA